MWDSTSARLIEGAEEAQKTLHGKLAEVAARQLSSGAEARFISSQLCGTTGSRALPGFAFGARRSKSHGIDVMESQVAPFQNEVAIRISRSRSELAAGQSAVAADQPISAAP